MPPTGQRLCAGGSRTAMNKTDNHSHSHVPYILTWERTDSMQIHMHIIQTELIILLKGRSLALKFILILSAWCRIHVLVLICAAQRQVSAVFS